MGDIGIVTVATNRYIDFYSDLIESFWNRKINESDVTFHVFTNEVERASKIKEKFPKIKIVIHQIANLKWPDATLKRFELYKRFFSEISHDYLVHIDADMIFLGKIEDLKEIIYSQRIMTLVAHPGFYRMQLPKRIYLYLSQPIYIFRDIRLYFQHGALGAWETRKNSNSFLRRNQRRIYVCGGIWFGPKNLFEDLIIWCSESVKQDSINGIIAKWHDESHLNAWAGKNKFNLENPRFCFEPKYSHLNGIEPIVKAVDKSEQDFTRVQS